MYFHSRHSSRLVYSFWNVSGVILIGISFGIVEFSLCRGTDCSVYFAVVRGWPASGFELHLPVVIHLGIWDDVVPLHLSTGCWNPVLFCRGMRDPTPHKGWDSGTGDWGV